MTTTKARLVDYFEQYGKIIDCVIMADRDHSKLHIQKLIILSLFALEPRGFGFITYDHIDSVYLTLETDEHYIDGKQVECKHAVPKDAAVTMPIKTNKPATETP